MGNREIKETGERGISVTWNIMNVEYWERGISGSKNLEISKVGILNTSNFNRRKFKYQEL